MARRKRLESRDLEHLSDEELLALKFCDLPLQLGETEVQDRIDRLSDELSNHGIRVQPHFWLSDEWFCPDGVPGIAVPFYLAHPRLERLEKKEMFEAEGTGERECMRILRHEAGHALSNAYRLHRRREWQRLFGSFRAKYPKFYRPKPNSKRYVVHLNNWYAQAHPAEDFAETFAVWLKPGSRWRSEYEGWPALRKLEYVDELMGSLEGVTPPVRNKKQIRPLAEISITLGRHYQKRKSHYRTMAVDFYTQELQRLFSNDSSFHGKRTAASFIRQLRREVRETVAYWTGADLYTVDQVIEGMTERSKELKLRLTRSEFQTRRDLTTLVTAITMNVIHSGRNRVAL